MVMECPKGGCSERTIYAESIGQVVHGNLTARSIVFNLGGALVTPLEATPAQLEALRRAHNRAIEKFQARSVGVWAVVFGVTFGLAQLVSQWLPPPPEAPLTQARLVLLGLIAFSVWMFAEILIGGWWREQRDTLRDLRRQRAAIRRELALRQYTTPTAKGEGQ
ncbi:MAG: hypothetical protein KatS3mg127_1239 [Silanimonas sp.]|nr:MAG: hypothetical protein KatS3mg127_1239 [Silanimonas sp.]